MPIVRTNRGAINSRTVRHGSVVYVSGLTADDKAADITGQTRQILEKIDKALKDAGTNKSQLLSAIVHLKDMTKKDEMNAVWSKWIDAENPPTRTCVGAELGSATTLIEITVTAAVG